MTIADLLNIAIKLEKNGFEYYQKASNLYDDNDFKELLTKLANDELDHEKTFINVLNNISDKESTMLKSKIDSYISVLINTIFSNEDDVLQKQFLENISKLDILTKAIQNEKDTILFYLEIKRLIKDQNSIKIFEDILDEEKNHLIKLEQLYSKYKLKSLK